MRRRSRLNRPVKSTPEKPAPKKAGLKEMVGKLTGKDKKKKKD